MRVSTDSVLSSFEYYNGIKYYRYEKAYTARAFGFKDTPFYMTILATIQNGKMYTFEYGRNYSDSQHFADIADMLNSISYDEGEIKINVNGTRIYSDSAPMIVDDRTLVPIRAVAEAMGYSVSWDSEKGIVYLFSNDGEHMLAFAIGDAMALKDMNEIITLDVPPIIYKSRTYLPLRAVAEAMDAKVNWIGESRLVDIWQ